MGFFLCNPFDHANVASTPEMLHHGPTFIVNTYD